MYMAWLVFLCQLFRSKNIYKFKHYNTLFIVPRYKQELV